jgi:ABC-type glycerol-3-phosphate transport system substrate-binding protein
MVKKLLLVALVLMLVVTASPSLLSAQEPVTIQWLEWWEPEYGKELMDELTSQFEAQTGIRVERTTVPWTNMYDLLLTNAQAGTATYDVLGMEACCFLTGIDKLGGLEDLAPYLERDADFAAGLTGMTPVPWRGTIPELNWYIFPYSYVYNVDMYAAAGVEPPTNWDEMVAATKQISEAGVVDYAFGEGFAGDIHHVTYYLFGSRLAQLGGRFLDENGRAVFNSPEGVAALQSWKDFYDSGLFMPGAIGMMTADAREALAAETIAAMYDGPFAQVIASQVNPDIRLAFPPAWNDVTGGYVWAGSGLSISSNSNHKEEAWEFIKFLLGDEMSLWLTEQNSIPYATNVAVASLAESEDPILREIPAMLAQDPEHNILLNPVPEQESLHREFVAMFQEVMAGNLDPQEGLDRVAAMWNEVIDAQD